jgi:mannose-6-phosphate isomerase-like protein (cupin superfamily)
MFTMPEATAPSAATPLETATQVLHFANASWRVRRPRPFVLVIEGEVEIQLGPEVIKLSKGDSLTFKGSEPHTWRNPSRTNGSQVIWVMAPASI